MYKRTLQLFTFVFLFLFISCNKEDNDGLNSINLAASAEGPRGSLVEIGFDLISEDGIKRLTATPSIGDPIDYIIEEGATSISATLTFPIPANAILGTTYMIMIEMEDLDGDKKESILNIITSPIITSAPSSYAFLRDELSSVSYSGQNERLDQVEAIKAYLKTGDNGERISASVLNSAYSNEGGNGAGLFSFMSTKQLKNKTFQPDLDNRFMENLFEGAEAASNASTTASNGTAGLIVRENSGNTVLVDANGREFSQFIEKGLMGTVMYHQIYNTYFSDERIGNDVENTELAEGKNYTAMEHHWDEAFGYWNPPLDFQSNWPSERESEDRFWSHYSNVVDPFLGTNNSIFGAFLKGRCAIVNNDLDTKNEQRAILFEQLELVSAATAVHYINDALEALNENKIGEAFHVMSEVWAFVNALKYSPNRKISLEEINKINETDLGENSNFWNVTPQGLNTAKSTLVDKYPALDPFKDQL